MVHNTLTSTFSSYINYYRENPNSKLTLQDLMPSLWGAFSNSPDIDIEDALDKMKADFETITVYLQEQHKRLYVEQRRNRGMRDSENKDSMRILNVYEASQEMGCNPETIRKAIREGRLKGHKPKGQRTFMITESDWEAYKSKMARHHYGRAS